MAKEPTKETPKEATVKLRSKAHIDFGDRQIVPGQKFDCPEAEVERLIALNAAEEIAPEEE